MYGDHAHYGITFDTTTENDEVVKTDKGMMLFWKREMIG